MNGKRIGIGLGLAVLLTLNFGGCGTPSVWSILTDTTDFGKPVPAFNVTCPVRVYLLRGLWDVYSVGLDSLAQEMRDDGIDAEAITGEDWKQYVQPIVDEYREGGEDYELVLVGHSFGSDDALDLANALDERGVPIRLVFLFDSTDPPSVPDNVARVMHLYIPTQFGATFPRTFAGNPVLAAPGNTRTVVENIIVSEQTFGSGVDIANHYQLESNPVLHTYAIDVVKQLCP